MKYTEIWYGTLLTPEEMVDVLNQLRIKKLENEDRNEEDSDSYDSDCDCGDYLSKPIENLETMNPETRRSYVEKLVPEFLSVECNQDLCCYPEEVARYLVGKRIDLKGKKYVKCIYQVKLDEDKKIKNWLLNFGFEGEYICVEQHCWCT